MMVESGYLLASFPELSFRVEDKALQTINMESYLVECNIILPRPAAMQVEIAVQNPEECSLPLGEEWHRFVYSLQRETAKLRWGKRKSGYFPQDKGSAVHADAMKTYAIVSQASNPQEAQFAFFRGMWEQLELLDSQYQSSLENVIIYAWKIQVLEKLITYKKEMGTNTWSQLVHSLTKKAGFSPTAITGGAA